MTGQAGRSGQAGRGGPDVETVRAAQAGHQQALDDLVAACLPLVYNVVGRALRGHADVDDVVQETLLRMVRHLGELRDPQTFRSWLVAIAIRQVRDRERHRRSQLFHRIDLDDAEAVPVGDFADATILRMGLTDQRREVSLATGWLDHDDRTLLSLWWLQEAGQLGRAEVASAMDVSAPHLAVRVTRMKEQMHTARSVVRALSARPICPDLGALTGGWDHQPSPLWRKRIARHVRDCARCSAHAAGLLPIEGLLAGGAFLPVPGHLVARAAAISHGSATGTHRAAHGFRVLHHLLPTGAHAAIAGVAVVAVVATTVVVVQANSHTAAVASASPAATHSVLSRPSATPSPMSSPTQSTSPSVKPSIKPSAKTAPPSTVPAAPPVTKPAVTSGRKGVSAWSFDGVNSALTKSGASWYYTWATGHSGITTPHGVDFVPMIWGSGSVTTTNLTAAKSAGHELLGFNEPDLGAQANMTVQQALDLWPKLMATGLTLGSPAVAAGGDVANGWLDRFMSGAAARGYRVDFITLHWYGSDFTTSAAVDQLKTYIQNVYARYHKPIWLTEYALIKFTGTGSVFPSAAQQAAFITASTRMLDGLSYVKRYAWFALPADDTKPSTGLFTSGAVATAAGTAFEAAR